MPGNTDSYCERCGTRYVFHVEARPRFALRKALGRKAASSSAVLGLGLAILFMVFVAPAPALDASDQRVTTAAATPLPMFKDPRAALRAGLES